MAITLNGWPVRPTSLTPIKSISTSDTGSVRSGPVAELFQAFVNDFNLQVEALTTINGYRTPEYNAQIGGVSGSNHISGTALDLNGAKHPYERNLPISQKYAKYKSGFTTTQINTVNRLLAKYGNTIKWGLYFNSGYRDAMHFEIRASESAIKNVLASLTKSKDVAIKPVPIVNYSEEVTTMDRIILALYRTNLKREPSAVEMDTWLNVYASTGNVTAVYAGIYNSPEAKKIREGA